LVVEQKTPIQNNESIARFANWQGYHRIVQRRRTYGWGHSASTEGPQTAGKLLKIKFTRYEFRQANCRSLLKKHKTFNFNETYDLNKNNW